MKARDPLRASVRCPLRHPLPHSLRRSLRACGRRSLGRGQALGRRGGFSLIEMMVAITIAAILLAITVPGMRSLIALNTLQSTTNDFMAVVQLARTEAISRGMTVILRSAGSGGDFTTGWQLFADADGDGVVDAGELVRSGGAATAPMTVRATANFGTDITFDSAGRSTNGAGTVMLCFDGALFVGDTPNREARSRAIQIDGSGRARVIALLEDIVALNRTCSASAS